MPVEPVNAAPMELDELSSMQPNDPLAQLARQDLDRLSADELQRRIGVLEQEIARTRARMAAAANHRANADELFRR